MGFPNPIKFFHDEVLPTVNQVVNEVVPPGADKAVLGGFKKFMQVAPPFIMPVCPPAAMALATLNKVDPRKFADTKGTTADWGKVVGDWFYERTDRSLGTWDTVSVNGQTYARVRVTDMRYAHDLEQTDNLQGINSDIFKNPPVEGQEWSYYWTAKPEDLLNGDRPYHLDDKPSADGKTHATGGHFNIIQSVLGSYETDVKCVKVDAATGNVTLQYTVTNPTNWQSATRVPGAGGLLPNRPRGLGAGGNMQEVFTWQQTFDSSGRPIGDVKPVG